jgi:hypothetical protein
VRHRQRELAVRRTHHHRLRTAREGYGAGAEGSECPEVRGVRGGEEPSGSGLIAGCLPVSGTHLRRRRRRSRARGCPDVRVDAALNSPGCRPAMG